MLSIKTRIINISIDSYSLNVFSSLLPQLSQIKEKPNVLSKMCDILGFLNFLYLLQVMQQIFFFLTCLESIHQINF